MAAAAGMGQAKFRQRGGKKGKTRKLPKNLKKEYFVDIQPHGIYNRDMRTSTNVSQVNLPIEVIINLIKALDIQTREQIFEEVFIECDTAPLERNEKKALKEALEECERGETIRWKGSV